ncbi:sugar phosphate isomerase/epimerase family protein [Agrococcus baldri]|uniref:Tagatose 3-epimerase n=1 Tax=Agrococcus baldri TaxID=153730 RepID=A0AA87USD5_9MICO|nr:sugar phosphate isomerase/epimerase family protein [Agrococcus baldri]GEK80549.1 tagatose 3-epimerase [Agrococcus baldri]
MRSIGINTWVWQSPLRDETAPAMLDHVASLGFDLVELPLEQEGDLTAAATAPLLQAHGLAASVVGAMGPGRALVATDDETVSATQRYLRACIDFAADIGAPSVCGPFTAETGRTWRMDARERAAVIHELRERLAPVLEHAAERGVSIGIEPLNRYETSIITTVEQALDALEPLLGEHLGLALDTYHLGIEERSSADAIRAAGDALAHVQVCGNDRGAPGGDQTDWPGIRDALDEVGYRGPLVIESFTAENASIAVAASIWRPLAATQDDLARDGLAFLRELERT